MQDQVIIDFGNYYLTTDWAPAMLTNIEKNNYVICALNFRSYTLTYVYIH